MTDEQIIEMAEEAKLRHYWETSDIVFFDEVRHFAKLVAQHEREACAKVCEDLDHKDWAYMSFDQGTLACADAIRARGEA